MWAVVVVSVGIFIFIYKKTSFFMFVAFCVSMIVSFFCIVDYLIFLWYLMLFNLIKLIENWLNGSAHRCLFYSIYNVHTRSPFFILFILRISVISFFVLLFHLSGLKRNQWPWFEYLYSNFETLLWVVCSLSKQVLTYFILASLYFVSVLTVSET